MKNVEDLKKMSREPASKEWFAKHGLPKAVTNHPAKQSSKGIALDRAKVSKEEVVAKFKAAQIKKFGGVEKFQKHLQEGRDSIKKALGNAKAPSEKEKSEIQKRTGRGYNE